MNQGANLPARSLASTGLTEVASIATSTCPGFLSGIGHFSTCSTSGGPKFLKLAAFMSPCRGHASQALVVVVASPKAVHAIMRQFIQQGKRQTQAAVCISSQVNLYCKGQNVLVVDAEDEGLAACTYLNLEASKGSTKEISQEVQCLACASGLV